MQILGSGIPDMKLEFTLQHAFTCKQLDKRFIYPPPSSQQKNSHSFQCCWTSCAKVSGCHCIPIDNLSETEKADAQKLVVAAFEHQGQIVPYDDKSPSNSTWMESPSSPNVGTPLMIAGYDCTQPSTSQVYKKRHPPSLPDEVWRLKKICKNGVFRKRLSSENVRSVQDFRNAEAHDLVITAFEQWRDVVSFNDEASFMDGSSRLFNNDLYSNSAMVETSDGCKILTSPNIARFDNPQSSVCSPDIMPSSICSIGGVNSLDDFGFLHNIDNMDVGFELPPNFSSQVVNSLLCETESITQTFYDDDHLQYFDPDCSLQSLKSSLESKIELHTSVNAFLLSSSSIFAQKRWTVLISVLKWFLSIMRIMAKKTHRQKSKDTVDWQPRK
ncbi:Calmodulin-binding protein 60 A [Camellia lanceoleosa]|uniref:Calmodulin-binding protein 60 A n=1 Tax=Camellia lanceoleosa TaxID=1840588 RepID=A0ACC0I0Y3_9ERIC|nr:Calmodulin-binding protein 60 A [Camellia lanceoleosa]